MDEGTRHDSSGKLTTTGTHLPESLPLEIEVEPDPLIRQVMKVERYRMRAAIYTDQYQRALEKLELMERNQPLDRPITPQQAVEIIFDETKWVS